MLFPGCVRQQPFEVLPPVLAVLGGQLRILIDEHIRILEGVEGEDRRDVGVAPRDGAQFGQLLRTEDGRGVKMPTAAHQTYSY